MVDIVTKSVMLCTRFGKVMCQIRSMTMDMLKEAGSHESSIEDEKRNRDFVQVYRRNMPELRWLIKKNHLSANVLFFLIEHMNTKNSLVCSYEVLQDYFDVSRMSVYRAIKVLQENGFIGILKSGNTNIYVINHEVAWSTWENQKKYAKLDGVILVSHKENKDYDIKQQSDLFKTLRKRENIRSTTNFSVIGM